MKYLITIILAVLASCSATDRIALRNHQMQVGVAQASAEVESQAVSLEKAATAADLAEDLSDDALGALADNKQDAAEEHMRSVADLLDAQIQPSIHHAIASNKKLGGVAGDISEGLIENSKDLQHVQNKPSGIAAAFAGVFSWLKITLIILLLLSLLAVGIYFSPVLQPIILVVGNMLGWFQSVIEKRAKISALKNETQAAIVEVKEKRKVEKMKIKKGVD